MKVEAQGLQCDAHLPGSSQPVFCHTEVPASSMLDSTRAPFLLDIQVCPFPYVSLPRIPDLQSDSRCVRSLLTYPDVLVNEQMLDALVSESMQVLREMLPGHKGTSSSLQSTWVPKLQVHLPSLAVAVDDSLVQFLERVSESFASDAETGGTSTLLQADGTHGHLLEPERHIEESTAILQHGDTGEPALLLCNQRTECCLHLLSSACFMCIMLTQVSVHSSVTGVQYQAREWRQTAIAEARIASGPRLLIEDFAIGPLSFLIDIHVTGRSRRIPFAIDTQRCFPLFPTLS